MTLPKKPAGPQFTQQVQMQLEDALAFHQRGDLIEAQIIYEAILKQWPKHFDALHMLGVIAYQKGDLARAQVLLVKALKINARVPSAHNN